MKKLLSFVLIICIALSFAACSDEKPSATSGVSESDTVLENDTNPPSETDAQTDAEAVTNAETEADGTDAETKLETEAESETEAPEAETDAETEAPKPETDAETEAPKPETEAPKPETDAETDEPKPENSIVGRWKTSLDMSSSLNDLFAGEDLGIEMPEITGFIFDMIFEFNEDGTYKNLITEDSAKKALENIRPSLTEAIATLYETLAAQFGMTLEDFLAVAEIGSVDEIVDQLYADESFTSIAEGTESSGKYMVEGNKFYTTEDLNGEFDKTEYTVFTVENDKLIITEIQDKSDEGEELSFKDYLPMVFTKL